LSCRLIVRDSIGDAGQTLYIAAPTVTCTSSSGLGITSVSNGNITIDPHGAATLALGSADNTAVTVDEATAPFFILAVDNHRRGRYTLTTDETIADDAHSAVFTVQNSTTTPEDIILMQCTSNHAIEVHPFNVSAAGWDFIVVNRTGSTLLADAALVLNFPVISYKKRKAEPSCFRPSA
jgi:hypothetical protein